MSIQTDDSSDAEREYPFHTGVTEEGETIMGVLFRTSDGEFFEFVNPDTHDQYAKYRSPRTGETITHESKVNHLMGKVMGSIIREYMTAERWLEFREQYVNAGDSELGEWRETWREITSEPR